MRRRDLSALLIASALALPGPARAAGPARGPAVQPGWEALLRLAARLRALDQDGLTPRHYDIPEDARATTDPQGYTAALYASAVAALSDLLLGHVPEYAGRPDLRRDAAAQPLAQWQARLYGSAEPAEVIEQAALLHPDMPALRLALHAARARVEAGGWPSIPPGGTLDPGMEDATRIPALRARLAVEDAALAAAPDGGARYDAALEAAVRRWQAANALEADGRVGAMTQRLLNRPAEARVGQIRVAMDQRRGQPTPPPGRRIEVNIPEFRLRVLEGTKLVMQMPVIVGKTARATPMLAVRMTAVQFNPPWGVPERNAREDLLPKFRRDPRAMMEKGFRLFTTVAGERVEVDPMTVDWASVNPQRFPYFVRQDASDVSALGRLKFVMPNGDDIYLHDTPDRHLFSRADRALSSGCIRLSQPMELLDLVLEGAPGWNRERAQRALDSRQTSFVGLARTLPVRLHYDTVVVEDGQARLLADLYGLDGAYLRLLDQKRPAVTPPAAVVARAPAPPTSPAKPAEARAMPSATPVRASGEAVRAQTAPLSTIE
ncbi:L,D-transpeptidase family protein [Roseomonas sp. GC11]|uniref:L,D-transpeptidase family protein n=1 Tax=Roseomonas sp. GC11 TaxID=2950546 RepID=UPI00210B1FF4|nr:L,D-transpeptidase family protein [Roseomonas sp. GC11]MCQ4158953.1 L,D-transpeptidase family protein [Roseomonas sp. GC11]